METSVGGGSRRNHLSRSVKGSYCSSTREHFLDLSDNFLSMSPTLDTESSEMASDSEPRCGECEECTQGQVCTRSPIVRPSASASVTEADVMEKMMRTLQEQDKVLKKVEILSKEVNSLKTVVTQQNSRIKLQDQVLNRLAESCEEMSGSDRSLRGKTKSKKSSKVVQEKEDDYIVCSSEDWLFTEGESELRVPLGKTSKRSSKMDRIQEEKERILKVAQDALSRLDLESDEEIELFEKESDNKGRAQKVTSKVSARQSVRHKQAGANAASVYWDSSSSSCESDEKVRRHRQKRQVKSGSKVKKRPVKRTELWPHTIAVEDDGEEVSCDDIGFAKILSCFTYIMSTCEKTEAKGRTSLLHAVSMFNECLPWADARTFHNIVKTKLEQDVLRCSSDFTMMSNQFVDKMVRQGLKSKKYGTDYSSSRKNYGK